MLSISYKLFFDKPAVLKAVKDGTRSAMSKAGAFIRTAARRSIRKRRKVSQPGQPPSSHVGTLRDRIFFGYDESTRSLVVGPELWKRANPPAPSLLEFGGTTRTDAGQRANYRARPFMAPALASEQDKFPNLFSGAVKGG